MKRPFRSCLAKQFEKFVYSKSASQRWSQSYEENLHFFDNYCADLFPNASALTEEMLEWCNERPTENGNSCRYRITVMSNFVKYAREKGWTEIAAPKVPSTKPCTYVPHAFTKDELIQFFQVCDKHATDAFNNQGSIFNRLNKLELPVYFRFLLSTGMRTNEARWMKRSDVDWVEGVININQSKGNSQHRVALHASTLKLLKRYDEQMAKVMPNRTYFFPDKDDHFHRPAWAEYHFRNIWKEVSKEPARPYDLRSHYAVLNITRWKELGFEIHDKLLYLSRTMGHRHVSSTYGYFNLSPALADKLKSLTEESFNNLLPKLHDYEQEK
ncbi:MAG: tyrosine-type recombinase/integrase [Marinilabiliaceae bacterium]|nr:tyrosine-type recombinase/integrase [Marinilabiliaceae bacterium]